MPMICLDCTEFNDEKCKPFRVQKHLLSEKKETIPPQCLFYRSLIAGKDLCRSKCDGIRIVNTRNVKYGGSC